MSVHSRTAISPAAVFGHQWPRYRVGIQKYGSVVLSGITGGDGVLLVSLPDAIQDKNIPNDNIIERLIHFFTK